MKSKELTITYPFVRRIALIYISLPMFCFFMGWLKWYWAVLSCIALTACLFFAARKSEDQDGAQNEVKKIVISKKVLLMIVVISLVYLFFCGVGRLWAQSSDYRWRNAIFRDLITRGWPVLYDAFNGALSYYIAMWLPSAIIGKLVYFFSRSEKTAFFIGNVSLLVYCTLGLIILFLLLLLFFQTKKTKQVFIVIAGFIFFSGLDILMATRELIFEAIHVEWWASLFQYSSMTTCICWVFNQAFIPWICMALLINEKTLKNYVLIGMACLFSGPFPFIGLFIYCIANGIKRLIDLIKAKEGKGFIREAFSVTNIVSALIVFPVIGSYLLSNAFMAAGSGAEIGGKASDTAYGYPGRFMLYVLFLVVEFATYALLIYKENRKDYLYYVTVLQLIVYPLLNFGVNSDFTMRASIPGLFMMYILCYRYLLDQSSLFPKQAGEDGKASKPKRKIKDINILYFSLVFFLIIGAGTPSLELIRGCVQVKKYGIDDIYTDSIYTLNRKGNPLPDEDSWPPLNFVALDLDNDLFFKYLARR